MSRCRSCRGQLRWERTEAGKAIPLDANPNREGNVIIQNDKAVVLGKIAAAQARLDGRVLFMPHFSTCPERKTWAQKAKG